MKKKYLILLSLFTMMFVSSCNDANDWGVDASCNRLFRPLTFEVGKTTANSVSITYSYVPKATQYVFEFSEGDEEFTEVKKSVTILADTLTAFAEATDMVKTTYRTLFDDLKGSTDYNVRMKAVSADGTESGYLADKFTTPDEQIFTDCEATVNTVMLQWTTGAKVTHIIYSEVGAADDAVVTRQITDEEMAAGKALIEGLASGTQYTAVIYNDDAKRGTKKFKTLGMKDGKEYTVQPEDDVNKILAQFAAEGTSALTLIFPSGTYEIGKLTIPTGISDLYIAGNATDKAYMPELFIPQFNLQSEVSSLTFQNIDLNARKNSANYLFDIKGTNCFNSLEFDGCRIRNINRSFVRFNTANLEIEKIKVNSCILESIATGGYGFINTPKSAQKSVGLFSLTNSTLVNMGSDWFLQINAGWQSIVIDKCTFYSTGGGKGLFRFDANPEAVSITNTIFAGANNGNEFNAGSKNYEILDFNGCYKTNDMKVSTKTPFLNIEEVPYSSEDFFVAPADGDFHIKGGVSFGGLEKAGDPRWY